jgi:biopolymer transport protein ExbB
MSENPSKQGSTRVVIRIPAGTPSRLAAVLGIGAAALAASAAYAAEPAVRMVDNPYGLETLWAQGDAVARGTLAILVVMSMATWFIMILKLFEQARLLRQARCAKKDLLDGGGIAALSPDSPFHGVAAAGVAAVECHRDALAEAVDLHTWVTLSVQRAVGEVVSGLQGGLAVLATVGSTAPFVGLFGTVWGIYHALTAIGTTGQASIDKVAGPVGEALIMTAVGLAVAVPAVLGYNWLVRRNKAAGDAVRAFAADLHLLLLSRGRD